MENNRDIVDYQDRFLNLILSFLKDIREQVDRLKTEDIKEQQKDIEKLYDEIQNMEIRLAELKGIQENKAEIITIKKDLNDVRNRINIWHGGLVVLNAILGIGLAIWAILK